MNNDIPGLDAEVYFGEPDAELPDWRETSTDGPGEVEPDDELTPEEKDDLIGMLGFDPDEMDEEETPEPPKVKPGPYSKRF